MQLLKKVKLFGIDIVCEDKYDIIKKVISSKQKTLISTISMPLTRELKKNKEYLKAIKESDVVLPDGIGIVLASKLINKDKKIKERVTGPDFFYSFSKMANKKKLSYFFMGSTKKVLNKIKNRIKKEFPLIKINGLHSPPFGEWSKEENDRIVKIINKSKADALWIGMTAPKQELWSWRNKEKLNTKIIASIGAAFDFFAGTKKRAPKWIQKAGFEWLYRTFQEPLRMGKRYMKGIPIFISYLIKEKFGAKEKDEKSKSN